MSKPFIFVSMPFDKSYNNTYEIGIKEACESLNIICERVDKQPFIGNILDRTFDQIKKADIIIADLSEEKGNVFYEVGYAHAFEKKIILISQTTNIPFNVKHIRAITYDIHKLLNLRSDLKSTLESYFKSHEESTNNGFSNLTIGVQSNNLDYISKNFKEKDKSTISIFYKGLLYVSNIIKADIGFQTVKLLNEKGLIDDSVINFLKNERSSHYNLIKKKEHFTQTEINYRKYRQNNIPDLIYKSDEYYVIRDWGISIVPKFIKNITTKFPDIKFTIND